jgi:hypothetical protein
MTGVNGNADVARASDQRRARNAGAAPVKGSLTLVVALSAIASMVSLAIASRAASAIIDRASRTYPVRHLMCDDQMELGFDDALDVVAHNAGLLARCRHVPAVEIGFKTNGPPRRDHGQAPNWSQKRAEVRVDGSNIREDLFHPGATSSFWWGSDCGLSLLWQLTACPLPRLSTRKSCVSPRQYPVIFQVNCLQRDSTSGHLIS